MYFGTCVAIATTLADINVPFHRGSPIRSTSFILATYNYIEPTGPPTNVRVEAISSTAISISWEPPDVHEWNGVITSYYAVLRSLSEAVTIDYEFEADGDCWMDCTVEGICMDLSYMYHSARTVYLKAQHSSWLYPSYADIASTKDFVDMR